jgi:predicted dehydrogenase
MKKQARPVAVYATSKNSGVRGFEPDPVWNIMIRFDNGATGTCLGNIDIENGYDLYHNIAGSKGGFIFDSRVALSEKIRIWSEMVEEGQWVYPLRDKSYSAISELETFTTDMILPDSGNVMDHQVEQAIEHFLESVRSGKKSPLSFYNARMIGEIGWAARISAKFHTEVLVPLSKADRQLALNL